MAVDLGQTLQIQQHIDRLQSGDPAARDELIRSAYERLLVLTRKMLRDFPIVRRYDETADVFQGAAMRLDRSLRQVTLQDARHFLRLAALHIRQELIDLARRYRGPQGRAKNECLLGDAGSSGHSDSPQGFDPGGQSLDPQRLSEWQQLHEAIAELPDPVREVFDLLWYHELSQVEAAQILKVDERTIRRRWADARVMLYDAMGGSPPPL